MDNNNEGTELWFRPKSGDVNTFSLRCVDDENDGRDRLEEHFPSTVDSVLEGKVFVDHDGVPVRRTTHVFGWTLNVSLLGMSAVVRTRTKMDGDVKSFMVVKRVTS